MAAEDIDMKDTDGKNIDFVIYHKNCPDGFGSALAAYLVLGDTASYYAASHNSSPPDVTDKVVVICDFSYDQQTLEIMIKKSKGLLVIDHHISAQKKLKNIPNKHKIFDMSHSGAYLTWKYFHPDVEVPKMIQYIEDRDIWKFELPETKFFSASFKNVPFEFDEYMKYLDEGNLSELIKEGKIIHDADQDNISKIVKYASCRLTRLRNGEYYNIAYLNSSYYQSDLGNVLIDTVLPQADFAAIYSHNYRSNNTHFSLRSSNEKTDVEEIATMYGGGGHRNASGLSIRGMHCELEPPVYNSDLTEILDSVSSYELVAGEERLDVISLNATTHQRSIGCYLLQKYPTHHIACIFSYNQRLNITKILMLFNDKKVDNDVKSLIKEMFNAEVEGRCFKIISEGFIYELSPS